MAEGAFYNHLNSVTRTDHRRLRALKDRYGTWGAAWESVPECARDRAGLEEAWDMLAALGIKLILQDDADYPPLLKEIAWAPLGIYIRGELAHGKETIAIVGTRKATEDGIESAERFAYELAGAGITVVSGLALGIDAAAHRGALRGNGKTIAVLGNGLDHIYPRTNERLAHEIIDHGGAVISEYPLGSPTLPYHFLERNRIVSGLSRGVLVVEVPKKSGALVTAHFAVEQNRDVFVVPGPAIHHNFAGSHELIRSGAELVTSTEHILYALYPERIGENAPPTATLPLSIEETAIIAVLRGTPEPLAIDKIVELTNLKANVLNQAVSFLIIKNMVKESERGYRIA